MAKQAIGSLALGHAERIVRDFALKMSMESGTESPNKDDDDMDDEVVLCVTFSGKINY